MLGNQGSLSKRNDGISVYTIVGHKPVENLLKLLLSFLIVKKTLAKLTLNIIEMFRKVENEADFLEVCKIVESC